MIRPVGMQFQFGILKMGFETPFQRNTEEREGEEEEEEGILWVMGQIDRGHDIKVLGASKSMECLDGGFNIRR